MGERTPWKAPPNGNYIIDINFASTGGVDLGPFEVLKGLFAPRRDTGEKDMGRRFKEVNAGLFFCPLWLSRSANRKKKHTQGTRVVLHGVTLSNPRSLFEEYVLGGEKERYKRAESHAGAHLNR